MRTQLAICFQLLIGLIVALGLGHGCKYCVHLLKIFEIKIFIHHLIVLVAGREAGCIIENPIQNGYVSILADVNELMEVNQKIANFGEVEYHCETGYHLVGSKRNLCVDGNWYNSIPTCELLCRNTVITSPTYIANCYVKTNNGAEKEVRCSRPARPGTIARINCQLGYEYRSVSMAQQVVTCREDGHWYPRPTPCCQICGEEGAEGAPYIVGGFPTNITKVPWNVGIYHRRQDGRPFEHVCGGTILNAKVVISAMHCFWDRSEDKPFPVSEFRVIAGKYFRQYDSKEDLKIQTFSIDELHHIEDYASSKGLYSKDIVILILDSYLDFNTHISPVCMDYEVAADDAVTPNSLGRVAGWGLESSNGLPSPVLKYIELPVIEREQCRAESNEHFVPFITSDKFCAGYLTGRSVCQGDSGAGLVFDRLVNGKKRFYLRGIVSIGANRDGSCDNDKYTTFTNVANFTRFIKYYEIPHRPENQASVGETSYELYSGIRSTSCAITEIPINGFVSPSSSPGDFLKIMELVGNLQVVEYTCLTNLTLVGNSRNICFKGNWIAETPRCSAGKSSLFEYRSN